MTKITNTNSRRTLMKKKTKDLTNEKTKYKLHRKNLLVEIVHYREQHSNIRGWIEQNRIIQIC